MFANVTVRERHRHARLAAQTRALTRDAARTCLLALLGGLVDERLVDVGDHTTAGDGRLDQGVELLVTADGELEVAGGNALDLRVPDRGGRVGSQRRRRLGISAREKKRNGQKKRLGTDSNAARRSVDRKASATPNGNVPVSGAGGRRERRCRRNAP